MRQYLGHPIQQITFGISVKDVKSLKGGGGGGKGWPKGVHPIKYLANNNVGDDTQVEQSVALQVDASSDTQVEQLVASQVDDSDTQVEQSVTLQVDTAGEAEIGTNTNKGKMDEEKASVAILQDRSVFDTFDELEMEEEEIEATMAPAAGAGTAKQLPDLVRPHVGGTLTQQPVLARIIPSTKAKGTLTLLPDVVEDPETILLRNVDCYVSGLLASSP